MRQEMILFLALPLIVFGISAACAQPDRPGAGSSAAPAEQIAGAAKEWLSLLDTDRAGQARIEFGSEERFDWHYFPGQRAGLPLKDMSEDEKDAARALIRATLSEQGAMKVEAIMSLEAVLREIEGSSSGFRDPENYTIAVFGEPGAPPWGWRVDGHHLSVNVTVAADTIAVTPTFTGTNPARIPGGPRAGERIQHDEYFLALELAQSLDGKQRAAALLQDTSLGNIVTGPGRGDALKEPEGVAVPDLSEEQRKLLLRLAATYVGLARDEIGARYMDLVRAGLNDTRFAWAGGMEEGEAFYYRIHGPRVLIEFDNTQNNANHIHSIWRDPADDFARDTLKDHYEQAGSGHGHEH